MQTHKCPVSIDELSHDLESFYSWSNFIDDANHMMRDSALDSLVQQIKDEPTACFLFLDAIDFKLAKPYLFFDKNINEYTYKNRIVKIR